MHRLARLNRARDIDREVLAAHSLTRGAGRPPGEYGARARRLREAVKARTVRVARARALHARADAALRDARADYARHENMCAGVKVSPGSGWPLRARGENWGSR